MNPLKASLLLMLLAGCSRQTREADTAQSEPAPAPVPAVAAVAQSDTSALPAGTHLVTVEVGGMVCDGCIELVGRELKAVPGVHRVAGSLEDQRFEVAVEPQVADTSLTTAVRRAGPQYLGMINRQ